MPNTPKLPKPYASGKLPVGHGHVMHYEQYGNPQGIPVVRLHGGPGSGSKPKHALLYDLKKMHLILFDQRGCGQSTPYGEVRHNTLQHLVADIETLRQHLKISRWMVVGSSWGSTLALTYAQAHPKQVTALVVSAIFTATRNELEWFTHPTGMARFAPREYAEAIATMPGVKAEKFPQTILKVLSDPDKKRAHTVARAWTLLECMTIELDPQRAEFEAEIKADKQMVTRSILFWHYFANNCFLIENQLLKNAKKIAHIPTHILQGALDLDCPPGAAYALSVALPKAQFSWEPLCGHFATPRMQRCIKAAIAQLAKALAKPK